MTVKKLTDTKAIAKAYEEGDNETIIDALLDKIEADNPGWRNSLPVDQKGAMSRRNTRRGRA